MLKKKTRQSNFSLQPLPRFYRKKQKKLTKISIHKSLSSSRIHHCIHILPETECNQDKVEHNACKTHHYTMSCKDRKMTHLLLLVLDASLLCFCNLEDQDIPQLN